MAWVRSLAAAAVVVVAVVAGLLAFAWSRFSSRPGLSGPACTLTIGVVAFATLAWNMRELHRQGQRTLRAQRAAAVVAATKPGGGAQTAETSSSSSLYRRPQASAASVAASATAVPEAEPVAGSPQQHVSAADAAAVDAFDSLLKPLELS